MIEDYALIVTGQGCGDIPERVAASLKKSGYEVLLLDYSHCSGCSLRVSARGDFVLEAGGKRFGAPTAMWLRFKLYGKASMWGTSDEYLRATQWWSFLNGLALLFDERCLNPFHARVRGENKLFQHRCAAEAGFLLAPSIVALGKQEASSFILNEARPCIMKALQMPLIPVDDRESRADTIITTPVPKELFLDAPDEAFLIHPIWYQEQLREGKERRIMAVKEDVFAYELPSEVKDRRVIDSRILEYTYSAVPVDQHLSQVCQNYLSLTGLDYGVFDVISQVSDGEQAQHYFLECNPEGQFVTGLGINGDEIVDSLSDAMLKKRESAIA